MSTKRASVTANATADDGAPRVEAEWKSVGYLTGAHVAHDMSLGTLGVLLPFLRSHLGFSLLLAGLLVPARQAGSLVQPVLGHIADNFGKRRFVLAFLSLSSVTFSLLGLSFNYISLLIIVIVGGLSSAAYHPAGSALVTSYAGGKWGSGLAIYHFGGNIGLALGPLGAAWVVSEIGLRGTWVLAVPGVLWAIFLSRVVSEPPDGGAKRAVGRESMGWIWRHKRAFFLLWAIVLGRSIGAGGLQLFLPSLLLEEGYSLALIAIMTSGFFIIGGLGGLFAGWLSDKIGRHRVIGWMLFVGPVSLLLFLTLDGWLAAVFLLVASVSLRGEQPVVMALIQEWAPLRRGTVVGLVLGVQFVLAGLGTGVVGWLADSMGLNQAFRFVALTPLLGLPLVRWLPVGNLDPGVPGSS